MATTRLGKEKAIVQDMDFGLGTGTGTRGGEQINAGSIPYNNNNSIAEELDSKTGDTENDGRYAKLAGNTNQLFSVQTPTSPDHSVNKGHLDSELSKYPLTTQVASALATKAELAGSSGQVFNLASPIYPILPNASEGVNFNYLNAWFTGSIQPQIDDKANKVTTLDTVVEHAAYTPTLPMHPSTKAYVDQKIVDIGAGDMTVAEYVDSVTASIAVYTTKSIGDFTSPLGISSADQVMRVSANILTDINNVIGMGIHLGPVDGMLGDLPPATAGTTMAVEQLVITGSVFEAQRATTDQGYYFRSGDGVTFSVWTKTATEADIGSYAYSKAEVDALQATQDTAIALNTAKVGITQAQADAIVANSAKISYTDGALVAQHTVDIAANTDLANTKIGAANYATSTIGGTLKSRLDGTTWYVTDDGSNA